MVSSVFKYVCTCIQIPFFVGLGIAKIGILDGKINADKILQFHKSRTKVEKEVESVKTKSKSLLL